MLLQPNGPCAGGKPFGQRQAGPSLLASACTLHASAIPPVSPLRQPAVHTWQTLLRLAKEDLYLVFDLLEFASILVKEGASL